MRDLNHHEGADRSCEAVDRLWRAAARIREVARGSEDADLARWLEAAARVALREFMERSDQRAQP